METLDDLLIKRRRGSLAAAEERRLDSALRASREYELALLAHEVFDRDGEPLSGDAGRLRELIDGVARQLPSAPPAHRSWRAPQHVAVALLAAGAAAAAFGISRTTTIEPARVAVPEAPEATIEAVPAVLVPAQLPPSVAVQPPAPPELALLAPEARESQPRASATRRGPAQRRAPPQRATAAAVPLAAAPSSAAPPAPAAPAPASDESAQSLFRRANRLRRSDWPAAADLYVELIRRHPTSNEAGVSEVALGKWFLAQGRSGDALEWFRAYQRRAPGALSAEALFGEARSLESIGSHAAARVPWRRLLESYPDSPYANVARQRLGP